MNADITYTVRGSGAVAVFMKGSGCVGHIKADPNGGFYYQPKGHARHGLRGDTMDTIKLVTASIEGEQS